MDDYGLFLVLAMFSLVGVWAIVVPSAVFSWAKRAHPNISENDAKAQSVARFIGAGFVVFSTMIFVALLFAHL